MKTVAHKTGLTSHVIRVWERRYAAVTPERSDTNRRLYSDHDVKRLSLLRDLTHAGYGIGTIAKLPTERLRTLAMQAQTETNQDPPPKETLLDDAVKAVSALNAQQLEEVLNRASVQLGTQGLLQRIVAPLVHRIGELWRDGTITAAHEHFASAVIRIFLGYAAKSFVASENAPMLVVATPNGQLHELGALIVGTAAANLGWNVTYLGASLPAAELAGAVRQSKARAVALSLVYPEDDPRLESELIRLRELLGPEIPLLVGGRAAPSYRSVIEKVHALEMKDLADLCQSLDQLRRPLNKEI